MRSKLNRGLSFTPDPATALQFLEAWLQGWAGFAFQSATSAQVHQLYLLWCESCAIMQPLQHTVFSEQLVELCNKRGIPARVKVMLLKLDPDRPRQRVFLVEEPPFHHQGKWAAEKVRDFESRLIHLREPKSGAA